MADWMNDMANAVEEAEAAQARAQEEVATEPAISPREAVLEVPVNDGQWTTEEYAKIIKDARDLHTMDQAIQQDILQRQRAQAAEHEAHERSIREWEAELQAKGFDVPSLPVGPPPQGIASQRELPRVHEALRRNDPSITSYSQPVVKKAPPTCGRPMPSVFIKETEPPRIGSGVQPPPPAAPRPKGVPSIALPLAETPMTPSHPPRPPLSALPKHPSMETSSSASKHALDPPTEPAPPSKQVRHKAFPKPPQAEGEVYVAASASVETPQPCRPCAKGPPATYMPTPPEIAFMPSNSYEKDRQARLNDEGKYLRVKSPRDIDWNKPLYEQLAYVLQGGPSPSKSHDELRAIRARVPELTTFTLNGLFPADNVITVTKNHAVHKIYMTEPAAWVLNATHWFSLLDQPMMIVIWCRNWEDASKFQYLMQILEAQFKDYVPRYQILMFDDSKIYGACRQWQEPSTIWEGTPVMGFMAETYVDDLSCLSFKDFNPMWTYPMTAVYKCWDALTFGMPPWHIAPDNEHTAKFTKDALQSQSPIAAFKSTNMMHALGIAYSKTILPSGDSKAEEKQRTYCPTTWSYCYQWEYAAGYADQLRQAKASPLLCKETTLLVRIQLSNKSQSHPACAFADCDSTVMCGAMISLTPYFASKVARDCTLEASMSFRDDTDMIQQLNSILASTHGFPQIPAPRKDCHTFYAKPDERHKQMVICPEQDCEWVTYMHDVETSMVERLGIHEEQPWMGRLQDFKDWQKQKGSKSVSKSWTWVEGSSSEKWSKGSSKRGQSVPVDISQRTDPEEKGLDWRTLDVIDTSLDFLFPKSEIPCPVEKSHQLSPDQQETYIKWIRDSLKLEKNCKDPRIYCAYCDMSNHPRFACKHVEKHRNPLKEHRCTLCKGRHAPFQCPLAQVNGGPGQPNWYKQEYKKAKSEGRAADYRWGIHLSHDDVDGPASKEQPPQEVPPPTQCAAAAMMHGMAPASSLHGGCQPIQEHQPCDFSGPVPGMTPMQYDVILPNPDFPIPANLWDLNIPYCAHMPSPLSTFIRHCNTMQSPHYPSYGRHGAPQPVESITDLNRSTASIENLRELQKYSEKLAYESTCCRLWADGILTHIKDEQEKVYKWIDGMTEELVRAKRSTFAQPHWVPSMTHPLQPAPPVPPPPHASSSSASMVQVKPAPYVRNPSTASGSMSDPWAEARKQQQR